MISLQDICRSRYLLYRNLTDSGFEAGRLWKHVAASGQGGCG